MNIVFFFLIQVRLLFYYLLNLFVCSDKIPFRVTYLGINGKQKHRDCHEYTTNRSQLLPKVFSCENWSNLEK